MKTYQIFLAGDECLDVYQYGWVERISPEAPVPIFRFSHEETRPGMAGNVRANLINLNCLVNDSDYHRTKDITTKTRLIDLKSKQQLIRIDNDVKVKPMTWSESNSNINMFDAVVVSDYDKGSVSYEFIQELRQRYQGPIFVDTKKTDLARLEGCIVKINEFEYARLRSECTELVVTLGHGGAKYKEQVYKTIDIEVTDTCGAGDTFLAAMVRGYLDHKDLGPANEFANLAAAVTVKHIGVYAPSFEEINRNPRPYAG